MNRVLLLISLLSFITYIACNFNCDPRRDYELQERCGKRAEQVFKIYCNVHYMALADYESHYNTRLKKCFILIKDTRAQYSSEWLIDVNENKRYGTYEAIGSSEFCVIKDKPYINREGCKQEWDAFVKRMMEE